MPPKEEAKSLQIQGGKDQKESPNSVNNPRIHPTGGKESVKKEEKERRRRLFYKRKEKEGEHKEKQGGNCPKASRRRQQVGELHRLRRLDHMMIETATRTWGVKKKRGLAFS